MTWNFRQFGTAADPIRQSALNAIASQNGCGKRYFLERQAEADGTMPPEHYGWRRCLGTAIHAVLERALTKTAEPILAGKLPSRERVLNVLDEELVRAADGDVGRIDWRDEKPAVEKAEAVTMVLGALSTVAERASSIVAVEAPFAVEIDSYSVVGTIDLLMRDKDGALVVVDWKSGQQHLPRVVLDHGYQVGVYMHAVLEGALWPGTERETRLAETPGHVYIVHLRDFVAYDRAAVILRSLRVDGPAESKMVAARIQHLYPASPNSAAGIMGALSKLGLTQKQRKGRTVEWSATPGDRMPPTQSIWYRSERNADDVARLKVSLKTVVGTVRLGRAVERLGEQCSRCPFRGPCLGEGERLSKDEKRDLFSALAGVDVGDGGLSEEAA